MAALSNLISGLWWTHSSYLAYGKQFPNELRGLCALSFSYSEVSSGAECSRDGHQKRIPVLTLAFDPHRHTIRKTSAV